MTTTLAVANQKGGVAKTTSVASIGAALVELGQRVLLVDLDPQACLTFSLGIDPEDLEVSVHHVLTKGLSPTEVIVATDDGVDLLPATIELARAEADLLTRTGREHAVKAALELLDDDDLDYDWVLLDCPPSLGVLTVAALTAAQGVLIPLQCETLSHRGVGQLLDTVHDVRRFTNRGLEVWGVLPTLYDGRTNHARTVLETISETYDLAVIEPPIPKTIKFAEAPPAAARSSQPAAAARARRPTAPWPSTCSSGRRAEVVSTHRRDDVRPRYGRITAAISAFGVTCVAVLAGFGILPSSASSPDQRDRDRPAASSPEQPEVLGAQAPEPSVRADLRGASTPGERRRVTAEDLLPTDSGSGRRVVYSEERQRVWLVGDDGRVRHTHLVSGSVYDNLDPGTFEVYSRSMDAVGIDDSGHDEVLRALHPGRHRRRDRLPRHPRQGRGEGAGRRRARHPHVARLHPAEAE